MSDGIGHDPLWAPDGSALFYLTPEAAMVVSVETGETFQRGTPRPMFSMAPYYQGGNMSWDISPDGQRFPPEVIAASREPRRARRRWFTAS